MSKDTVRQIVLGALVALIIGGAAQAQTIKGFSITVIGVDGKPLAGAKANLLDLSNERNTYTALTEASGEFIQTGISYSDKGYKFTVEAYGGTVSRFIRPGDPDLRSDDSGTRKILLTDLNILKVDLRKCTAFQGVAKEKDGTLIAGAKVKATNLDDETKTFEATTNGKGEYKIENLPFAGKGYRLSLERAGQEPAVQNVQIPFLGALSVDMDLSRFTEMQVAQKAGAAEQARDLYKMADFEGALPLAEEALKSEDTDTRKAALLIKGQCLDKLGRNAEALAALEQYLPMDPQNKDVVGVLSRLAEASGDKSKAEKYQKQFVALGGKIVGVNYNKGVEALNAGDLPTAVKALEAAVQDDPADADAHKALAMTYARTGNYKGVVDHLKVYLKLKPDAPDRGQWEAAIPTFENMAKSQK